MNLSHAMRYGPYPGAIACLQSNGKRILAHVCRQGGCYTGDKASTVPYWWTVSVSCITWEPVSEQLQAYYGATWAYFERHTLDDTISYKSINGCYTWLKERGVSPHEGWYPTHNERHWSNLGRGK